MQALWGKCEQTACILAIEERMIRINIRRQTFKNEGRHYKSTIETDQQFIQHCYRLDYGMHNLL